MTISKKKPSKATSTASQKTSRSKIKEPVLHLKTYHFDKKAFKKLAKDSDVDITKESELTTGRKCRAGVNKHLTSVKRIHSENKSLIMQFKKELVDHDLTSMNEYLDLLLPTWTKLDTGIKNVELQIATVLQQKSRAATNILDKFNDTISKATTKTELKIALKDLQAGEDVFDDWDDKTWPKE